ncbi:MAG: flagellar basal body rod protein FlgC [Desulfobacteraceae bacterium]|nr:flagellar basal body rod protein FlgC [Desulfobacteraceae bacterium]
MDFDSAMRISSSGLKANRTWINVLSSNLANINTTKSADGGPYARKTVTYEATPYGGFEGELNAAMGESAEKVEVTDIVADGREFKEVYDPGHPDADAKGMVKLPNINPVEEMANLVNASRSYEANLAALQTAKQLSIKAIEIGAK